MLITPLRAGILRSCTVLVQLPLRRLETRDLYKVPPDSTVFGLSWEPNRAPEAPTSGTWRRDARCVRSYGDAPGECARTELSRSDVAARRRQRLLHHALPNPNPGPDRTK